MRRVRVILVVLCLAAPCAARPTGVLLIGDSIFAGLGSGGGRYGVAFQLQKEMGDAFVFNYAAPGASMGWFFAPHYTGAAYFSGIRNGIDIAVIGLGVNDWIQSVPVEYFKDKYEEFLLGLQQTIPLVVCVGPLWSSREGTANKIGQTIADYRLAISQVCAPEKTNRHYWDGLQALPADPHFFRDGLHPNRAGHRRYAKWIRDQLGKLPKLPAKAAAARGPARPRRP